MGGLTTISESWALLPTPPIAEETGPATSVASPSEVASTSTVNEHWAPGAIVPPLSWTSDEPGTACQAPPQVFWGKLGLATVRFGGSWSANVTPVRATGFSPGLRILKRSVVIPRTGIEGRANAT